MNGEAVPINKNSSDWKTGSVIVVIHYLIIDLILLDIIMPDMDGFEVITLLKTNLSDFLTAKTERVDEAKGLALGAVDYITKPINAPIMLARVQTHLNLREKSNELQALNQSLEARIIKEVKRRQDHEQLLIQQSKISAMGEMISLIAHQWRQPLSVISTAAGTVQTRILLGDINNDNINEILSEIIGNTVYLSNTIEDFRNFFRPNKERKEILINEVVEQTLKIIGKSWIMPKLN